LFIFFIGIRRKKKDIIRDAKIGLASIFVFVFTPVFSLIITDKLYEYEAKSMISYLEEHKIQTGNYPNNLNEVGKPFTIFNIKYEYIPTSKNYILEYSPRGTVTMVYYSETKEFENSGWND
jgi:hypothetical protein